jgi:hypothetical protein
MQGETTLGLAMLITMKTNKTTPRSQSPSLSAPCLAFLTHLNCYKETSHVWVTQTLTRAQSLLSCLVVRAVVPACDPVQGPDAQRPALLGMEGGYRGLQRAGSRRTVV